MASLSIEFPLSFKETPFGWVSAPKIPVAVRARTGTRVYRFLLDTGADFSLVPRWLTYQLGLDWEHLPRAVITGVEQTGLHARFGRLPVRMAGLVFDIRCFFLDRPDAMFVLGRADFLDYFVLTIDQPRRRIVLQAVDT